MAMAMAVKPEPIDIEAEQTLLTNSTNGSPARRPPNAHGEVATAISRVTSHPVNLTSHPVNFLTEQGGRPEMVVDPVQEDVVFLPPRPLGGRGHGRREVTEYATYTISHHEAELNSKLLPKKYRCRFCIYKTSYKSDLNRHLRKHGIAPQHCPLCNMPFKTTGNLENHMRQIHGDFVSSLGIIPSSSVPGLGAVEDGLVPPIAVGALGGVVGFAAQGSKADAELRSACEESRRRHRQLRLQLQQDFPAAVSQVVLSPATQLSCHVCPFVCSDSEVLARHLLTHPSEDEASRAERSSPALSDLCLTRLACNYCGTVLSSIDHLQIHRRSCVNPEDSQREGSRGLNSAVSPTGWQCDDEGSSGDNEKVGVPRQETMDRLRRAITTSQDEARAGPAKPRSPASQIRGSWNFKEQKSMVLPIIPADDVERTDQSRNEPHHDQQHLETSSGELLVVSSPEEGWYESVMEVENNTVNGPRDLSTHPADTPMSATGATRSLMTPSESHLEHNGRGAERKETLPTEQKRPLTEPGSRIDGGGEPRRIVTRRNKGGGSEDFQELPETVQKAVRASPGDRDEVAGPTEMNKDSEESVETWPEVAGERGHVSVGRNKAPYLQDPRNNWPKSADNSKEPEGVGRLPSGPGELQVYHNLDQAGERLSIKDEPKSPETSTKYETLESSRTYDDLSFLRSELVRSTSPAGPPTPSVAGGSHREFKESCVLCEQRFRSRAHLIRHLQRAHSLVSNRTLSSAGQASTTSDSRNYVGIQVANTSQQSSSSSTADPERERREARQGEETMPPSNPSTSAYFIHSGRASSASAVVMPAGSGSSARSENHQRFSSLAFPADSRGDRAASPPPDRGHRDARVASQPPTSGRYARLVSDFDEFSAKPYACALCFFRTASLGDLRVHVHNHLTGCNASPVPDTARFQPVEAFHVERSTSPLRLDSSAASSVNSVSPVSVVASDALAASADFHVSFAHARGGLRPAFDQGGSLGYHVVDDDHRESASDGESDQSPVNCADGQPLLSSTIGRPNGTHVTVDAMSTDGSCVMDLSSRTVRETQSPAVSQAVDSGDVTPSSLPGDGRDDEERDDNSAEAETRADDADDAHRGGLGSDEFSETPASLNTSEERLCDAEHSTECALDDSDLHRTGDLRKSSRSSNSLEENRLDAEHPAGDVQRPSSGTLDGSLLVADHNAEDGQCPSTHIVNKGLLAGDRPFSDMMDQGLLDADRTEDDDQRLTEAVNSQPNQPSKRSTRTGGTRHHTSKRNLPPEANSSRKVHRKQARKPSPKTILRAQRRRTVWLRAGLSRTRSGSDGSSKNRCETCGKKFSLGTLLARHLRFVHVA